MSNAVLLTRRRSISGAFNQPSLAATASPRLTVSSCQHIIQWVKARRRFSHNGQKVSSCPLLLLPRVSRELSGADEECCSFFFAFPTTTTRKKPNKRTRVALIPSWSPVLGFSHVSLTSCGPATNGRQRFRRPRPARRRRRRRQLPHRPWHQNTLTVFPGGNLAAISGFPLTRLPPLFFFFLPSVALLPRYGQPATGSGTAGTHCTPVTRPSRHN